MMSADITTDLNEDDELILQVTLTVPRDIDLIKTFTDFPEKLSEFLASVPGIVSGKFNLWYTDALSFGRILPQDSYAVVVRVADDEDDEHQGATGDMDSV